MSKMDKNPNIFLAKECDYLRDEIKLHVAETNSLAQNSILFTAVIVSIPFLDGKLSVPDSVKSYFVWLPFAMNTLIIIRAWMLGEQIVKISSYMASIKETGQKLHQDDLTN